MIEFSVKAPTIPIPFHKLLKVVAIVDAQDRQTRELLDHIAAEHFEIEVAESFDRDVSEDAAEHRRQSGDHDGRRSLCILRPGGGTRGSTRGGGGPAPRIGWVEAIAFVFSIFTIYGCGPTLVLNGLILLLLLGIPVYVRQRRQSMNFATAAP
jgi:hypothetical protein